jgi:hypothetical protein
MDSQTKENSIKALQALLDVYQGQLDARVTAEVHAVIDALRTCDCNTHKNESKALGTRVLAVTADILRFVTNVADLMNKLQ